MDNFARTTIVVSMLFASVLAGCSSGSSMPRTTVAAARPAPFAENTHTNLCSRNACIYVGNYGGNSITVFPLKANGNVVPVQSIAGNYTQLDEVEAVAVDATRNVYAANYEGEYGAGSLTEYVAGSKGNVAPIATISRRVGSDEMLSPSGIGLDASGNIYATGQTSNSISVYAPGSNGTPAPIQYIEGSNSGLSEPDCLAVTSDGTMYVTNWTGMSVTIYASGTTGNVAPVRTISGEKTGIYHPNCVAVDSKGRVYVSSSALGSRLGCCLAVFAKGANGNVAPIRSISGSKTQIDLPYGIAVDAKDNIYVSDGGSNSLTVYASGASGNVAPIRVISGSKTMLDMPTNLAIH